MASWISVAETFLLAAAQLGLHLSGTNTDLSHDDHIRIMSQDLALKSKVFYRLQEQDALSPGLAGKVSQSLKPELPTSQQWVFRILV